MGCPEDSGRANGGRTGGASYRSLPIRHRAPCLPSLSQRGTSAGNVPPGGRAGSTTTNCPVQRRPSPGRARRRRTRETGLVDDLGRARDPPALMHGIRNGTQPRCVRGGQGALLTTLAPSHRAALNRFWPLPPVALMLAAGVRLASWCSRRLFAPPDAAGEASDRSHRTAPVTAACRRIAGPHPACRSVAPGPHAPRNSDSPVTSRSTSSALLYGARPTRRPPVSPRPSRREASTA